MTQVLKHGILTRADQDLIVAARQLNLLKRVTPSTFKKHARMIYVLCNSGPELRDRMQFGWEHIADEIFPVMTFGGVVRLSSKANFFDEGVIQGVRKIDQKLKLAHIPLATEFHYPCRDICEVRNLSFQVAFLHALEGFAFAKREFGKAGREVFLFAHFSYPDGKMKTFEVVDFDAWPGLLKP